MTRTARAVELVRSGMSCRAAADSCGITTQAVYYALNYPPLRKRGRIPGTKNGQGLTRRALALVAAGASVRDAATECGVSIRTVYNAVSKLRRSKAVK